LFRRWALAQSSQKNSSQSVHTVLALACTSSLQHGSHNSFVILYSINEKEIMKWNFKHDGWKLVEQELLPLPEHLSSFSVFSGIRVNFMCMFCRSLFVLLVIALFVLRFTDSDYLPLVFSNSSSTFPLISTKQTNTYFLKLLNTKQSI
jgi:hypothetical protein